MARAAEPNRKNDQAWVEQKNGSMVRRLVGYGLDGMRAEALARLYTASRLLVDFFQPSFKLVEKHPVGARVSRRYHTPETPCARLLASASIDENMRDRLRAVLTTLDPLRLLDEIRTVQWHLAGLVRGEVLHVLPHRDAEPDRFLRSLATTWREGEVRPTHRPGPKPERHWRTQRDPFEAVATCGDPAGGPNASRPPRNCSSDFEPRALTSPTASCGRCSGAWSARVRCVARASPLGAV